MNSNMNMNNSIQNQIKKIEITESGQEGNEVRHYEIKMTLD